MPLPEIIDAEWWEKTEALLRSRYPNFFHNLFARNSELHLNEIRLCMIILLKYDTADIARVLAISIESLHTSRYRLRKRLGLGHGDDLYVLLLSFAEEAAPSHLHI